MAASQADILRREVEAAPDQRARLNALLTLARHHVDVGDGVNGYAIARGSCMSCAGSVRRAN